MITLEPHLARTNKDGKRITIRGWRARRNGHLLTSVAGSHLLTWTSEERARRYLARVWPGEDVVVGAEAVE